MTNAEIHISGDRSVAYLASAGALVKMKKAVKPINKDSTEVDGEVAKWGADNLYPQNLYKDIKKSSIVGPTLNWKARALYSGGLVYGNYDDAGKFQLATDDRVHSFLRKAKINRTYVLPAALNFYYFNNIFPETVLSDDRSQVVNITCQKSSYCRFSRQNERTGLSEKVFISANWDKNPSKKDMLWLPTVDTDYDPEGFVQLHKSRRFIYPVSYPSIDETYYSLAAWNSIRESGWYDVAQSIPAFKKAFYENGITIRYQLEIMDWYWTERYSDWEGLGDDDKVKRYKDTLKDFNDHLTGKEKGFKTVMSMKKYNPDSGQIESAWTITPLKNDKLDVNAVAESQEASSHLLFALGVHPTLIGNTPGNKMGAGSGSDQRVAFNHYMSLCQSEQDLILEPLQFAFDYNGWPYTVKFRNSLIQRLDSGEEVTEEV